MSEALQTIEVTTSDKQALGFLKLLDPTTNQFCFRTFDDVKIEIDGNFKNRTDLSLCSKTNSTLKEALPKLRHLNSKGAGVYVVINAGGQTTEDITRVRALFADTDGAPLEPLLVLKPHMVVKSSEGKWHVYWLVDNCELDKFTAIQTAIAHKYGTDPSIKDLPRVMRLAGFNHNKYGAYPSTIITYNPDLPPYKVDEVLSGLGIDDSVSLTEQQGSNEAAKLGSLFNFPLEKLGSDRSATTETYPFTPENAIEFLNAAKAAYSNGLPDRPTYFELGMALAELVVVHKWPKIEARKILDDVGSKPAGANKDNNDSEWENYLASTSARIKQGDPVTGHRSVVAKARANGWKPKIQTDETPEWLHTMNENLFVAPYSNTVAVFRKQDGAYIPLRSEAFKLLYSNKTVEVQSSIGSKRTPIADAWLKHQNRREYSGVGFWPAVNAPSGKFNKWQGWNVVPSQGDVSPALNHIKKVICNNDQSLYAFVIGWLANCVQHPNEQGHVALVIMGGRGTGKTMFAEWIKSIFGKHSMSIANSKLLTGDFTGHLEELVFLVAEEAFWAGDKAAENSLKHAITGSTLTVHHKGFAPYDAPNYLHVIMTSNEEWVIPAGVDERRFAVCTVSDIHKGDVEYFKNLALWASNGGISALYRIFT